MPTNFLEQLVAEWYEFQGYFVRRNVHVGKLPKGGWEGELDVVALDPHQGVVVHIEPSMDADSWAKRERRYAAKFAAGQKYIPDLFAGVFRVERIDQIALLVAASKAKHQSLGGGQLMLASELLHEILGGLRDQSLMTHAVPEQFTILRTLQFVAHYRKQLANVFVGGA